MILTFYVSLLTDLSKLFNVVKTDVIKKNVLDELVKQVNAIQNIDSSDLVKRAGYITKNVEIEKKIPDHDYLLMEVVILLIM